MESHYVKIYTGNIFVTQLIKSKLEDIGINPILKDNMRDGLTAVLVTDYQGLIEVFVHEDELDKATPIVQAALAQIEA